MGCVIADMRQDFVQTINTNLADLNNDNLLAFMQTHVSQGHKLLDKANTRFDAREILFELDMAYIGQTHTVSVPIPVEVKQSKVQPIDQTSISDAFDVAYRHSFGRLLTNGVKRIINLRTAVIGKRPKFDLRTLAPKESNQGENNEGDCMPQGTRKVHFANQWHQTDIYDRLSLSVGTTIDGPAILEQPDTTVLIEPGFQGHVDDFGNTIIKALES